MLRGAFLMSATLALCLPQAARAVTLLRSAELALDVTAPDAWCSPQPSLALVGPSAEVFTAAEIAALVRRIGGIVSLKCPEARSIKLNGVVRGSTEAANWSGSADAGSGWTFHPDAGQPDPAAPPPNDRPVALDAAGRAKAAAALGATPGRLDAARRCWVANVRTAYSNETACIAIVRAYAVAGQVHLLLQGNGGATCHACAGLAAFAVLDAAGPRWRVIARPTAFRDGDYGKPTDPAKVAFTRLGANRWGWVEQTAGIGQGYLEGGFTIYLQRGAVVAEVGQLPGDQSNTDACDSFDRSGCEQKIDYTVTLMPDVSSLDATAYPVLLHAKGTLGAALDSSLRVPFDETRFRYALPRAWP